MFSKSFFKTTKKKKKIDFKWYKNDLFKVYTRDI